MKLILVFTNDWELYGDGSGDFFEIQAEPMKHIIDLFDKYNAKMTFFAEIAQQLSFRHNSKAYPKFAAICETWENMVKHAIERGHDIQLHLHPQWIDAKYIDNKWLLNMDKWSIAKLNRTECSSFIMESKEYLENIGQQSTSEYRVIGFRSGSYCTLPSQPLIDCLYSNGICYDTSVTKGWYHNNLYDFRNAHSNVKPWYFSDNYNRSVPKEHSKLMEFPIYSVKKSHSLLLKKFSPKLYYQFFFGIKNIKKEIAWQVEKEKIKDIRYPKKNRKLRKGILTKLQLFKKAILKSDYIQLSYDDLPASVFVKEISKLAKLKGESYLPVVAIGHTKDIHNTDNLENILKQLNHFPENQVSYMSLTEAYNFFSEGSIDK